MIDIKKRLLVKLLPVFGVLGLCMFTSCGVQKTSESRSMQEKEETQVVQVDSFLPCEHTAEIVLDLESEPCGLLLKMPNGILFKPQDLPNPDFAMATGQKVRVSFEILPDQVSNCEKAKDVVSITCLQETLNTDYTKSDTCVRTKDAFAINWMKTIINEIDARRVTRYDYREQLAYKFEGPDRVIFTDCYGNVLCRATTEIEDRCNPVQAEMSNGYVILVVNIEEKR
ncbi:MAG: hypothetical protein R3275_12600 [Saprospiraceae bacterium]|nr:hypothetical protein [Saprospiraceae bacterium]